MKHFPPPLIALALGAFAIGTAEFVIMGLLPEVAGNLAVSLPAAGWLVGGYALGVFVGAPVMAMALQKLPHRAALLMLMGIFVVGNTLCAVAPSYDVLMAGRIVTSLSHGAFFGIGAVEAASLVPAERRGRAMALMFSGLTIANVLGVPLGTALGQAAGWRVTFWAVAVAGVAAFAALYAVLPRDAARNRAPATLRELAALRGPVWLALGTTVVASASMFTLFTYIAPLLNTITHVSAGGVTETLFVIGIGMTAGNLAGGRLADWRLGPTMIGVFVLSAVVLALLTLVAANVWMTEAILFVWAGTAIAGCSALQINAVVQGRDAPNLISTLNIGAFNAGNAVGAWAGGAVIGAGLGLGAIPAAASGIAVLALGLTVLPLLGRGRASLKALLASAPLDGIDIDRAPHFGRDVDL